jgi:hypothetical protein
MCACNQMKETKSERKNNRHMRKENARERKTNRKIKTEKKVSLGYFVEKKENARELEREK